jgi:hypothetical protein
MTYIFSLGVHNRVLLQIMGWWGKVGDHLS